MKLLVTGATGFVGQAFLRLVPRDWEIVALTRGAPPAHWRSTRISWARADLRQADFMESLPTDVDAIVHLAQSRRVKEFPAGAVDVVDIAVGATARLLDHAVRHGISRFVLGSSGTVYAASCVPLSEDAALDCSSLYPASKRASELLVQAYADRLSAVALRVFTVYGPGQTERLVSDLVDRVRSGDAIQVHGPRGVLLSPIYVDDVAVLLSLAVRATASDAGFEIVNAGGAEILGVHEIAQAIGVALGIKPVIEYDGGDDAGWVADRSKLVRLLAPPAAVPFEEGIRRTVAAGSPTPVGPAL